jgi:hypothetical protein
MFVPYGNMSYCLYELILFPNECDLSRSPQENLNKKTLSLYLAILSFLLKRKHTHIHTEAKNFYSTFTVNNSCPTLTLLREENSMSSPIVLNI